MNSTNAFFDGSELSLAAYANLVSGSVVGQIGELVNGGMSQKQAEEFAARWPEVIGVINDNGVLFNGTGLSATVFKS